jgi:glycosyltransferase involved in cell wall biosynthesis
MSKNTQIIFVNRFYAPDLSATSQILTDVAERLSASDLDVKVYTSRMSYDAQSTYRKTETLNGVQVKRVWSSRFGRGSIFGRACDYLTFYVSITLALLFAVRKGDILIAKTDPPMLSIPLGLVARLKRAKLVNWLQDVFPEVALNLGVGAKNGLFVSLLKILRNRSLKRAHTNVAIGERMAEALVSIGVEAERTRIIHNFVDDDAISATPEFSQTLRTEWGIGADDFVIGYSGNLGRAHDLDTVLDAASALTEHADIKFLFIGGGFLHEQLTQQIEARGLSNVILKPYQPRVRLPETLALPNLHWASLNPKLEGYIVPSKVYGVAAAGRPLLMIGDPDGEIGRRLSEFGFGLCAMPGDHEAVVEFILTQRASPELVADKGKRARHFLDQTASRTGAIEAWKTLIADVS